MSHLLGRRYVEALQMAGEDWPQRIQVTRPPRSRFGTGALRLIAIRAGLWVLAYEGYTR